MTTPAQLLSAGLTSPRRQRDKTLVIIQPRTVYTSHTRQQWSIRQLDDGASSDAGQLVTVRSRTGRSSCRWLPLSEVKAPLFLLALSSLPSSSVKFLVTLGLDKEGNGHSPSHNHLHPQLLPHQSSNSRTKLCFF